LNDKYVQSKMRPIKVIATIEGYIKDQW
jgi:hypothetical protein